MGTAGRRRRLAALAEQRAEVLEVEVAVLAGYLVGLLAEAVGQAGRGRLLLLRLELLQAVLGAVPPRRPAEELLRRQVGVLGAVPRAGPLEVLRGVRLLQRLTITSAGQ
jgi:hypothetical protein